VTFDSCDKYGELYIVDLYTLFILFLFWW
jgi:hypothetical protein